MVRSPDRRRCPSRGRPGRFRPWPDPGSVDFGVELALGVARAEKGVFVQPGERVTLYFTVKNIGEADSFEVQANVQNKSREGILLQDGRFEREEGIARGEEWVVPFTFQVNPKFQDEDEDTFEAVCAAEWGEG